MASDFKPIGTLRESPFIELAGRINQQGLSGSLYLNDGRLELKAERIIYFAEGEVYAAASNLAVDSALAILIRAGRVTEETAVRIQQEVATGRSFSEALVYYRCVSRDELTKLRVEHVKTIFNSLCEWSGGEYRFTAGDKVAGGSLGCKTKSLILEGALFARVPQNFVEMMADHGMLVSANQAVTDDLRLEPFAYFLLSCLNQPRNLVVLSESGRLDESEQDVLQQQYGLYCAGLVKFTQAATNPLLPVAPAVETAKIITKAVAPPARPAEPKINTALTWPIKPDAETVRKKRLQEIKRDVKKMRQLLSAAPDDYYVLGLCAGATPYQVKHAYRNLVNSYHPDRHHHHADPITLATLSEVLMAIRSSYETAIEHALLNEIISSNTERYQSTSRTTYRTRIEKIPTAYPTKANQVPQTPVEKNQAEKLTAEAIRSRNLSLADIKHRKSLTQLSRGEYEEAIRLMNDAVTLAPDCARYHGDLAALLEKVPMRREQAEQHLLRATELEPSNMFYHLQLGSFYRAIGLLSRAEQQFILALKLDPIDRAAATALEEVMSLKKTQVVSTHYGRKRPPQRQGFWSRILGRTGG